MDHQQKQFLLDDHQIDRRCNRRVKYRVKDVLLVSSLLLNLLLSIMFWPFPTYRSSHQVYHRDAGTEEGASDNNSQVLTWSIRGNRGNGRVSVFRSWICLRQHPAHVVAVPPHYGTYRTQTQMFDSADSSWEGDARAWVKRSKSLNSTRFVEIVASPNNPTGFLQEGVLEGQNVRTIYDHAYYWPHFTAITEPVNEDVMLFTLSKLTGHAGSRLGWAIVKEFDVYQKMTDYVFGNTLGVSHDTQLRATTLLKTIIAGYQRKLEQGKADESRNQNLLFHYAYDVMRGRWQKLEKIFSGSQRFSLQNLTSNYCSFFRTVTGPSPAYAWVKCEREEDEDCTEVMKSGGIIGRRGEEFEGEKRYVRLSLIKREDNFALLERRLQAFVSYRNFTVTSTT